MDFGDHSSARRSHLMSIRSHGLISSLAVLSQRTSQLLSLFPFLFLRQAPATFTFSSVFLLLLLFLSCLRLVTEKLVSCQGKTSWKMSAAALPPVVLGPLLNEGVEAE